MRLTHPVGIPAGLFKEASDVPWELFGERGLPVGFITIGGISLDAQPGNPRPRHVSIPALRAGINRYGLNSTGAHRAREALEEAQDQGRIPENLRIIANINNLTKTTDDHEKTYELKRITELLVDYVHAIEVNIACPNTASGQDLQKKLHVLVEALRMVYESANGKPIYLKISPDMDEDTLRKIIEVSTPYVTGYSSANTTGDVGIRRRILEEIGAEGLLDRREHINEKRNHRDYTLLNGGISGTPLLEKQLKTTSMVKKILTDMQLDRAIIGIGGIGDEESAEKTIVVGADAVALYSRLPQSGPGVLALANLGAARGLKARKKG